VTVAITGANSAVGQAILRRASRDAAPLEIGAAATALGVRLTSLGETIRHSLESPPPA